jgi:hypothetical protein
VLGFRRIGHFIIGQKNWAGQAMPVSIEKPQVEKHQSIESWTADIK